MTTTTAAADPAATAPAPPEPRRRRRTTPGRVIAWIVMIVILVVTLFPFYWMLRTALSSNTALATDPTSLLPVGFSLGGFERVFGLQSVEEAALIDGASKVRVFFTLILPMAGAPMATLALLTYMTAWNEYFWALMVSYTDSFRVLTVALAVFRAQSPQSGTDWAGLMAATLVAAAPMLILFAVFAKRIVNSIGFSGIK